MSFFRTRFTRFVAAPKSQGFQSPAQVVGTFASDEYVGRPHEYWKKYRKRVSAVTADDVLEAAKKHLKPEELVMLVVGNCRQYGWRLDPAVEADIADGRLDVVFYPTRGPLRLLRWVAATRCRRHVRRAICLSYLKVAAALLVQCPVFIKRRV